MANNKSAQKRIKTNQRNKLQNRFYKSSVKTLIKMFSKSLEYYKISRHENEKEKAKKILNLIYSFLDKGTKKHIFHKNFVARKKSRLAISLKNI